MSNVDLERVVRAAWRVQVAHRHTDGCPREAGWHSLVIETWTPPGTDIHVVGDVWSPLGRPSAWLLDFRAHASTTALVVVADGTMRTRTGAMRGHVVACVDRAGRGVAIASPDDTPPPTAGVLRGPLYIAMRQAMSSTTHDPLIAELAALTRPRGQLP